MAVAAVPFEIVSKGVALVGGTRVTLDTVIYTFLEGATPEEIVYRYPTLDLGDVYEVIAYYLHNKQEIEDFLKDSEELSRKIREETEARFPPHGIRERLLARKRAMS